MLSFDKWIAENLEQFWNLFVFGWFAGHVSQPFQLGVRMCVLYFFTYRKICLNIDVGNCLHSQIGKQRFFLLSHFDQPFFARETNKQWI